MLIAAPSHTIAILQVIQVLEGARSRGLAVEPLLRRAAIAPELLDSPLSRVTRTQFAALLRVLTLVTRDELWGLCTQPLRLGGFAQLCQILVRCRDLREAMHTGFRFYRLQLHDFTPRLVVDQETASVRLVSHSQRDPKLGFADRTFNFFTYGLASWLIGRRLPVLGVTYRPADMGVSSDGGRLFQASVSYSHPWVGFRFESRWLDSPIVQSSESLVRFLEQAPVSLLVRYRDQSSLTERIRRLLRPHLAGDLPSLEAVSGFLSLTPQTLRRRLHEEGQRFQVIKDDLRRDLAIEFLGCPKLTVLDIASQLGFSDASTFHRAFKGWTGISPGVYRQTHFPNSGTRSLSRAGSAE